MNQLLKKHNYYLTLSSKYWKKFLNTGTEKFLDKSIHFSDKSHEILSQIKNQ